MDLIKAIILGVVQGLTEFLPISSSGHLVIFQNLVGFKEVQLAFDTFLHFGTLIPIFIIFRKDIINILSFKRETRYLTLLILIGIIPTGLMGIYLGDFFESIFASVRIVAVMLLITGFILYLVEKVANSRKSLDEMNWFNALIVGIAQGFAIVPGISRSGSTIAASLFQGLNREAAARYSFLVSIPVIFGAGLLQLKDVVSTGLTEEITWGMIGAGTVAAAISGYFAIKYLLKILREGSLIIFSYYCWTVGLLILVLAGLF